MLPRAPVKTHLWLYDELKLLLLSPSCCIHYSHGNHQRTACLKPVLSTFSTARIHQTYTAPLCFRITSWEDWLAPGHGIEVSDPVTPSDPLHAFGFLTTCGKITDRLLPNEEVGTRWPGLLMGLFKLGCLNNNASLYLCLPSVPVGSIAGLKIKLRTWASAACSLCRILCTTTTR